MAERVLRIFSDLHYGDPASALRSLPALLPLFEGADELIFNGDTLDTRPARDPAAGAALRAEVETFLRELRLPVTALTGNHDPDFSDRHWLEVAGGELFVTHGDVLFDDLVPWGRDAALARRLVAQELAALSTEERLSLAGRLAACRRAAAAIPQRHQSERNGAKYLVSYLADTIWPPGRVFRVLRAWRQAPALAGALVRRHAPAARFFAMGHTHRFGHVRTGSGLVVLNTGSFAPPGAAGVIDVSPRTISLRRVERRDREYRLGAVVAQFALAAGVAAPTLRP